MSNLKYHFQLVIFISLLHCSSFAQNSIKTLELGLSLQMPAGLGTRGAGVVWNPKQQLYYAAYAGNASFPMGVFNVKGNRVSSDYLECMVDLRSIWYNPRTQKIEANGYKEEGWVSFSLNSDGIPNDYESIFSGLHQPDEQSQGVYDYTNNAVYFFDGFGSVFIYDRETGMEAGRFELSYDENEADFSNFDWSIILTKNVDAEIGILNRTTMEVDFFSKKTGKFSFRVSLPNDTHIADILSFSYCNGYIWILDDNTRRWNGFKL